MREVRQYEVPTANEEAELFSRIETGLVIYRALDSLNTISPEQEKILIDLTAAYTVLYNRNLRLVASIARKYAPSQMLPFGDMVQEGAIGLSTAIRRFDVAKGLKLSTFATQWIEQNITRAIANTSRTIRMPVHNHDKWLKVREASIKLGQKLQREPTTEEIAAISGIKPELVEELRLKGQRSLTSLNQRVGGDDAEQGELGDYILDPEDLESTLETISNKDLLVRTIKQSSANQQGLVVLSLRYGVYLDVLKGTKIKVAKGRRDYDKIMQQLSKTRNAVNSDGLTLGQIGTIFGVTRERIRQIEAQALKDLKAAAGSLAEAE